jgi:hypothetical protein
MQHPSHVHPLSTGSASESLDTRRLAVLVASNVIGDVERQVE